MQCAGAGASAVAGAGKQVKPRSEGAARAVVGKYEERARMRDSSWLPTAVIINKAGGNTPKNEIENQGRTVGHAKANL